MFDATHSWRNTYRVPRLRSLASTNSAHAICHVEPSFALCRSGGGVHRDLMKWRLTYMRVSFLLKNKFWGYFMLFWGLLPFLPPETFKILPPKPFHLKALENLVRLIYPKLEDHGKWLRYCKIRKISNRQKRKKNKFSVFDVFSLFPPETLSNEGLII